jgi:D-3-phosphoglycerate dehydrogenase
MTAGSKEMKKVVIAGYIHHSGIDRLRSREDISIRYLPDPSEEELRDCLAVADALLVRTAPVRRATIAAASKLTIVARHGVGFDNVDVVALTERRIPLAVVGNVNATAVAEHTLFLMLALAKRGLALDRAVRSGDWRARDTFGAVELNGRSLLILGFGRIGASVAKLAHAFGMKIEVYDPWAAQNVMDHCGFSRVEDWRSALRNADFVTLHLPLTAETRCMIGEQELAKMHPGAFLINAARGGLVDEAALHSVLTSGQIAGAALDTFDQEPPDSSHPIFGLDSTILSPHSAALTKECSERMAVAAAQNIIDGLDRRLDPALVINNEVLENSPEDTQRLGAATI